MNGAYVSHIFRENCIYRYTHFLSVLRMPKDRGFVRELQANRMKKREKKASYICSNAFFQILGSGAPGAPKCIYFLTDYCRYMFNCGEGTQRLANEHKLKISRLEHIFITHPTWENLGGLPGLALTVQDVGVPDLTIHGPSGIDIMFHATSRFIVLNNLRLKMAECGKDATYSDPTVTIYYIPLLRNQTEEASSAPDSPSDSTSVLSDSNDSDIDYYAHLKNKRRTLQSPEKNIHVIPKERCSAVAMSYVGKLKPKLGTLSLEACVEHGVPAGPLLGKLKNGEDVTLPDGKVVKSSDVKEPDEPGPVFIVIDCPSSSFLDSLLNEEKFKEYQLGAIDENIAKYVFHFTPSVVMSDERYQLWMKRFPDTTVHINVNDSNTCLGNVGAHILQRQLNHLDPEVFPLLHDQSIPIVDVPLNKKAPLNFDLISRNPTGSSSSFPVLAKDLNIPSHVGHTLKYINLRKTRSSDIQHADCVYMNPKSVIEDLYAHEEFKQKYEIFKFKLSAISDEIKLYNENNPFPVITFLGTGSSIPNKNRNTSAILITFDENNHMIMDCGEGTYDQLVRHFGVDEADKILVSTRAIYISHLHADHHLGTIKLLQKRRNAFSKLNIDFEKLHLLAPKQMGYWLYTYNIHFERIHDTYTHIFNQDLMNVNEAQRPQIGSLLDALNLKEIKTVDVIHCPHSFGISVVDSKNQKITYSGDTMPCKNLIELGKNSDLLIHEATFEDELAKEAKIKMHSTYSEAISVGKDMNAKFTILTHFSQRYYKIPLIDEFGDNVGVAFDNMRVRFGDLRKLPLYNPLLKIMFSDEQELLQSKGKRRKIDFSR